MNLDLWLQESEKIATSEVFSRLQFKVGHPVEQSLQVNEKKLMRNLERLQEVTLRLRCSEREVSLTGAESSQEKGAFPGFSSK